MHLSAPPPPPLAVSFPEGIVNGRHRYSVIEDTAPATPPRFWSRGSLVSWNLALGIWIERNLRWIETGAVVTTTVAWVGVVAWLALNLVGE